MGDASRLAGGELESIEHVGQRVVVRAGGEVVSFAARACSAGALALEARAGAGDAGTLLYPDMANTQIVRVQESDDRVTLHFADGEIIHVEAVRNADGDAVVGTRTERAHGRGATSLLDRALGKLRR